MINPVYATDIITPISIIMSKWLKNWLHSFNVFIIFSLKIILIYNNYKYKNKISINIRLVYIYIFVMLVTVRS